MILIQDGSGSIDKEELLDFVTKLMPLSDPSNDIDSICAAIDKDENGEISLAEFEAFIQPTMRKYVGQGSISLDMEEILHEAFKKVLADSKRDRDLILEAFMDTIREVPESADLFHRGWVYKIYDEFYKSPADPLAPKYQCKRLQYLKNALSSVVSKKPKRTLLNPRSFIHRTMPNLKSAAAAAEKFAENSDEIGQISSKRAQKTHTSISRTASSAEMAPSEDVYKKFCSTWLEKISSMQKAHVEQLWLRTR
jgi:hypothetical protein